MKSAMKSAVSWSQYVKFGFLVLMLNIGLPVNATDKMHHESKKTDIQEHMAWVRAVPPVSTNTAVYMMLHNNGGTDDRVIGAETPVAENAEIHLSEMTDGRMKMMKVDNVVLPAGGHVTFEPAGYHIMLINLKQPVKVGQSIPLTLILEQHGRINMTVQVANPSDGQSGGMDHSMENHSMENHSMKNDSEHKGMAH